jgi:hypothetical protein
MAKLYNNRITLGKGVLYAVRAEAFRQVYCTFELGSWNPVKSTWKLQGENQVCEAENMEFQASTAFEAVAGQRLLKTQ